MSGVAGIQRMYALPHEERVLNILRAYGATRARLFGSAARNELTPTSDIDILVEFGNDSGYQAFCKSVDASVELEQELHRPVDLALSIDPRMWQYIEPDLIELPLDTGNLTWTSYGKLVPPDWQRSLRVSKRLVTP